MLEKQAIKRTFPFGREIKEDKEVCSVYLIPQFISVFGIVGCMMIQLGISEVFFGSILFIMV